MAYENDGTVGPYRAPPMSIKEIADKAVDFDYNPLIPLRYWLRTADTLLKEVCFLNLLLFFFLNGRILNGRAITGYYLSS